MRARLADAGRAEQERKKRERGSGFSAGGAGRHVRPEERGD
jgi:hypothetical protein